MIDIKCLRLRNRRRSAVNRDIEHLGMTIPLLVSRVRSGVVHIEFRVDSERISSGSGFMSNGYLITNHHVFLGPSHATVSLAWQPTQDPTSRTEVAMPYQEFAGCLVTGSDESNYDFAVLKIPQLPSGDMYQFNLAASTVKQIGEKVVVLGFPLEHRNLVCHEGMISSYYTSGPVSVIQLDASVNQSNSGGPLLDPMSGDVIGIVTRKGTGLSRVFDELLAVFDTTITALNASKGIIGIGAIDPVRVMILSQQQMQALAKEIQRSANVGIGYAFSIDHLLSDVTFTGHGTR